jgi:hypothetical protein
MRPVFWWASHILVLSISTGFLILGVNMLRRAYAMQYPLNFLMAFFGSSMMILISGSLVVGFVIRIVHRWREGDSMAR